MSGGPWFPAAPVPCFKWRVAMERAWYYSVTDGCKYQVFGRRHELRGWVYAVRRIPRG